MITSLHLDSAVLEAFEGIADHHGRLVLYGWPVLGADLSFLNHPSYGWLDAQWDTIVVRALGYLRAKGCIPA